MKVAIGVINYVIITYESQAIAQRAITMFNGQMCYGQQIYAAMSYHVLPPPGRSQPPKGMNYSDTVQS